MVREFFGSIVRLSFIVMLFVVMAWGIIQFVDSVPNEKSINSVVLFILSIGLLLNAKPMLEDLGYYFKQAMRSLSHEDRKSKE